MVNIVNNHIRDVGLLTIYDIGKGGMYLSFRILACIALHDGECAKSKQFAERIHLERLPIIHSLSEVRDRSSQVFLVDGVICSIQHGLDGINGFSDVCLELRVFGLLAQFLQG